MRRVPEPHLVGLLSIGNRRQRQMGRERISLAQLKYSVGLYMVALPVNPPTHLHVEKALFVSVYPPHHYYVGQPTPGDTQVLKEMNCL